MELVLLSGGSGKRLWPLSNESRSKQFLKVLKSDEGFYESMVQRVWRQISQAGLSKSTIIATGKSQVDILKNQLDQDIPMVIEPERRDTFPAIALSASFLYSVRGINLDEIITVLPVDPFVDIDFFVHLKKLEKVLHTTSAQLALVGVKPTYPSSKYGYIIPEGEAIGDPSYIMVNHFVEKPDEKYAEHLIEKKALWNCGVFSFKLQFLISLLQKLSLPIQYEELKNQYHRIPKNSFDFEVVEKTSEIVALSYEGSWKDLGTWNTLTDEMSTNQIGKGVLCNDSENTHLVNELDIPVAVLGISDAIIAVSPDGILVADKNASPQIKSLISTINQRPMYEERRWGWYKVLDYMKYDNGQEVLTRRIGIKSGQNISYHRHLKRSEIWNVMNGEGFLIINEQIRTVVPGSLIEIPIGTSHAIKANTDLEIIEIQKGSELEEEDVHRMFLDWDDIISYCNLIKG